MHRCFLFPVVLTVQLVVCLCCSVAAFPRPLTLAVSPPDSSGISSSSSSEEALQYRPRLLTLLRLGLLSSPTDLASSSETTAEEDDDDRMLPAAAGPAAAKRDFDKKMDRREGPPRLSIVNPLDVLRQKMLLEILRVKNETTQRIVDENAKVMERLGKRNVPGADRSLVRPSRQRLDQMLSSLIAAV